MNNHIKQDDPTMKLILTPAMVEAGFRILSESGIADAYSGADRLLVAEIYRAMFAVLRGSNAESHQDRET